MAGNVSDTGFSERRPLNGRQISAITRLLAGDRVSLVAEAVGISERQLWRWLKQPAFRQALAEAQGAAMTTTAAALVGLCLQATDAVEAILQDDTATHAARLRAAQLVFEHARALHEMTALESRVSRLEERIGDGNQEQGQED